GEKQACGQTDSQKTSPRTVADYVRGVAHAPVRTPHPEPVPRPADQHHQRPWSGRLERWCAGNEWRCGRGTGRPGSGAGHTDHDRRSDRERGWQRLPARSYRILGVAAEESLSLRPVRAQCTDTLLVVLLQWSLTLAGTAAVFCQLLGVTLLNLGWAEP